MKPQLIIPMTGVSSRFTAAGYTVPKFLLQVDGQTVLEHVLDMYPGWDDPILCCNEIHLDNPELGLEDLIRSKRPKATIVRVMNHSRGPGAAVYEARHLIDQDRAVVVNYCDFTCYWDSEVLADELQSGRVDGCIPAYTGFHPHMEFSTSYAYVKIEDGLVTDIQEKQPWTDSPQTEFASSGTYGFASGRVLIDSLEAQFDQELVLKNEYYLSLTYKPLLAVGGRVSVMPLQHFMQWGTPQDFEEYRDTSVALEHWSHGRTGGGEQTTTGSARVVLASGAGRRFSEAGYDLPKPALPLSGKTLLEHSLKSVPGTTSVIVTRDDLDDSGVIRSVAENLGAQLVSLKGLSRGQAESALFGLEAIKDESLAVTVTACDAIATVPPADVARALEQVGSNGLVVWLVRPYHRAHRIPEQYGWVAVDDAGVVGDTWLKESPRELSAGVICGTFSFGSVSAARSMITSLIEDGETVNGEFYLDSLVPRAIAAGFPVRALVTRSFLSVGTPTEYETVRYWQSCFDKWPLHPYSVATDPMVSPRDRMDLRSSFLAFDSRTTSNRETVGG